MKQLFLVLDTKEPSLYLNDYGEAMGQNNLGNKVKRYMKQVGIEVPGSCHLLRHAMATHMLENGADIRFIQAMLGHGDMRSTQIYTHVSIRKLREVHANTHPAKLKHKTTQKPLESTHKRGGVEYTNKWYMLAVMTWTVYLTRKAHKQLVKLPRSIQDLADLAVADLEEQGINPQGWNTLKTDDDEYRLRLNYRYRMRYRVTDEQTLEIEVFYAGHRREAYR